MRRTLLALLGAAFLLGGTACEAADDVRSGVNDARSSAASLAAGTKQACTAAKDNLTKLGDLSQRLADNPDLRTQLAPQIRATSDQLISQLGSRPELGGMVAAARDLTSAVGDANAATVEAAARQTVVAVKGAQGVCNLAT